MLSNRELREIVEMGITLTTEKNTTKLMDTIVKKAMEISCCDTGALYLLVKDYLQLRIVKSISMKIYKGKEGEKIDYRPVNLEEKHICAYCCVSKELINIEDIDNNKEYDFSAARAYEAMAGYHTKSMLAIPLISAKGEVIGVLQLINAMNKRGDIIAFSRGEEFVLRSLASQAAVSISNVLYLDEIRTQIHSFVSALATAIDARTPYNGSHTRKVAVYAGILAEYINKLYWEGKCEEYFDEDRKEQLLLAATLHDIGKMIVPLEVMNKATRLDGGLKAIEDRFKLIKAYMEIEYLKGMTSLEAYHAGKEELDEIYSFMEEIDSIGFLSDDNLEKVKKISLLTYKLPTGEEIPYLTEREKDCLSIRRGTLTDEERKIMESHASLSRKILDKVHFTGIYAKVNDFASNHHECLDGSGYPRGLTAEELELESRIMAVVDIFDALTSSDRPYKKPMSKEKAFEIIDQMVENNKLDKRLVDWLKEALEEIDIADIENYPSFWD